MARLPDRFDLWVRKARGCEDPARQVDYVLGAMAALGKWHFLNVGTVEAPRAAESEDEMGRALVVFTDVGRMEELMGAGGGAGEGLALPVISMPTAEAMKWCVEQEAGLMVNPGEDGVVIAREQVNLFYAEWRRRAVEMPQGFWIPNLTSEEEDFWQEHGL